MRAKKCSDDQIAAACALHKSLIHSARPNMGALAPGEDHQQITAYIQTDLVSGLKIKALGGLLDTDDDGLSASATPLAEIRRAPP